MKLPIEDRVMACKKADCRHLFSHKEWEYDPEPVLMTFFECTLMEDDKCPVLEGDIL